MFFGHISNYNPKQYPEAIQYALRYLKNTDFNAMETGVYELKGRDIYVQVLDLETKDISAFQPEVHRNYLDVQYLHKGKEKMAFAVDNGNNPIHTAYLPERDIQYYQAVENEQILPVKPVILPCFSRKIAIEQRFLMALKRLGKWSLRLQ
ncbi:uncharacterized protein, YhcH/YjgK/YiaL family [Actinobacillus equuli]|nr:uncharacterized protein, YhcH/YjgK/YiaL family [Actinobacillus equuli]